jgi:very-short-patch-repair endonuclease
MGNPGLSISDTALLVVEKLRLAGGPLRLKSLHALIPRVTEPELHRATQELIQTGFVEQTPLGICLLNSHPRTPACAIAPPAPIDREDKQRAHSQPHTFHKSKPSFGLHSRWQVFRQLCRFYAECARLEERGAISAYADREGEQFLSLSGSIDLNALSVAAGMVLPLAAELENFVVAGRARRRHPSLFLGGPVAVQVRKDRETNEVYRIVRPIFVAQVLPEIASASVRLRTQQHLAANPGGVQINHDWLEHRFRDAAERKEFLSQVGLIDPREWAEDEEAPQTFKTVSLMDATRRLRGKYPTWWKEPGDLGDPCSTPRLSDVAESGVYNRLILVQQQELKYSGRMYKELMRLADEVPDEELDQTSLRMLFPHLPPNSDPAIPNVTPVVREQENPQIPPNLKPLNPEQRDAVQRSLRDALLVVTGPPGTGKSVVVQHAMIGNALRQQSVLFASRNHEALRAVVPGLNALVEPEQLVCWPGQKSDGGVRGEWFRVMAALLARPRRPGVVEDFTAATDALQTSVDKSKEAEQAILSWMEQRNHLATISQDLAEAQSDVGPDALTSASTAPRSLPTDEDINRVGRPLVQPPGTGTRALFARLWWRMRLNSAVRQARAVDTAFRSHFGAAVPEPILGRGAAATDGLIRALARWRSVAVLIAAIERERVLVAQVKAGPTASTLFDRLSQTQKRLDACTRRALKLLAETAAAALSPQQRTKLAELSAAMQNATGAPSPRHLRKVERAVREAFPELIKRFPLWTVTNLSVHSALPLAPATFDLVVVDEASQCDIGSVVPLLFRAKRAMIVGDPMQLRHISRIAADLEYRLRQGLELVSDPSLERFTHRVNSVYMLASTSPLNTSTVQLVGHFRCHPDIAELVNTTFYNQTLDVLTNTDGLCGPEVAGWRRFGCEWLHVAGDVRPASSGCFSPGEIEEVTRQLLALEAAGYRGTVGVVTPFRVQANRINDAVSSVVGAATLERWRFIANTADAFQGGERDTILFSLVGSENMPAGSRLALAGSPNRFNVAFSRARALLRVIGDRDWARRSGIPHVQALDRACQRQEQTTTAPIRDDLIGPVWEPKFAGALRAAGLPVQQQYPACGRYLDIALVHPRFKMDIEVDGECHRDVSGRRKLEDVYRDQILEAAGWSIKRFWVYQLREDFDACVDHVKKRWDANTKFPEKEVQ